MGRGTRPGSAEGGALAGEALIQKGSVPRSIGEFERWLEGQVESVETPSAAFAVSHRGEVLWQGAAGYADVTAKRRAACDTPYALASITKPITAAAVLRLAERGLVDLDRPINQYLGGLEISSRSGLAELATVRHVGSHTAGLPLHFQFYYSDEDLRRPPFAHTVSKFAKTFWRPGERFVYSNLGFGLMDHLLESVTGSSYADVMDVEIFGPSGMVGASTDGLKGNEAVSYGPDGVAYPRYEFSHPGGSAIYASVEDLIKFGNLFLGSGPKSVLSPKMVGEAYREMVQIGTRQGYGFGWGHDRDRLGFELWQHDGAMGGVRTRLTVVPELELVIAVLANGESSVPREAVDLLLAVFSPFARELLVKERSAKVESSVSGESVKSLAGLWEGTVEHDGGKTELTLLVRADDSVEAIFGRQVSSLGEAALVRGALVGVFDGSIPDPEAEVRPHRVHLDLVVRGEAMAGAAVAIATQANGSGGAIGKRVGDGVSFWTELRRVDQLAVGI